jgi:hypothetical protein
MIGNLERLLVALFASFVEPPQVDGVRLRLRGHRRRTALGLPPPGAPTPILEITIPADTTRSAI